MRRKYQATEHLTDQMKAAIDEATAVKVSRIQRVLDFISAQAVRTDLPTNEDGDVVNTETIDEL